MTEPSGTGEIEGAEGRLLSEAEMDHLVARWHTARRWGQVRRGSDIARELHEYIGISWEDYQRWAQDPTFRPSRKGSA